MIARDRSVLEAGARAWGWWTGELRGLLPRALTRRPGERGTVEIRLTAIDTRIERVSSGIGQRLVDPRPLADLDAIAWEELATLCEDRPVRVLLTPPDIYCMTMTFPRGVGARLRQAVALQMGERAPLMPDQYHWNLGAPRVAGNEIAVDVVLARIRRLASLRDTFEGHGLSDIAIHAEAPGGSILLGDVRPGSSGLLRRRPAWAIALLLLASIPFTTIVAANLFSWFDGMAITGLEDQVARVTAEERRARSREDLRAALAPLARQVTASRMLDELADRIPHDASLTDASSDGRGTVTLSIDVPDPGPVTEALDHDPIFRFQLGDEAPLDDGAMHLVYRGRRR